MLTLALLLLAGPVPCDAQANVPKPAAADPAKTTCRLRWRTYAGSGTCVACEGGRSLVVTNGHVCPCPGETVMVDTATGKTLEGVCLAASHPLAGDPSRPDVARCARGPDLSLVCVAGEMPAAELADALPKAGARVEQWTMNGHKAGAVVGFAGSYEAGTGTPIWDDTVPSQSGDSGAGMFAGGKVVAVRFGGGCVGLGTVRAFVRAKAAKVFPELAARVRSDVPEPPQFRDLGLPGGPVQSPPPVRMPAYLPPLVTGGS